MPKHTNQPKHVTVINPKSMEQIRQDIESSKREGKNSLENYPI